MHKCMLRFCSVCRYRKVYKGVNIHFFLLQDISQRYLETIQEDFVFESKQRMRLLPYLQEILWNIQEMVAQHVPYLFLEYWASFKVWTCLNKVDGKFTSWAFARLHWKEPCHKNTRGRAPVPQCVDGFLPPNSSYATLYQGILPESFAKALGDFSKTAWTFLGRELPRV